MVDVWITEITKKYLSNKLLCQLDITGIFTYLHIMKPAITIEYCPKCNWMLRAAYMAQELLSTFNNDIYGVTLQPSETPGKYNIRINDVVLFDRKEQGRFPEIKELKQLVRDVVNPDKSLGHADTNVT